MPAALVAALDTEYQAAVERNDWQTMDRILHPDFTLVLGNGKVYSRAELIESARDKHIEYEKQVEMPGTQTVRVFGDDTATVTALLWLKGTRKRDQSTSNTSCGSATPTCARNTAGATRSGRLHCGCRNADSNLLSCPLSREISPSPLDKCGCVCSDTVHRAASPFASKSGMSPLPLMPLADGALGDAVDERRRE